MKNKLKKNRFYCFIMACALLLLNINSFAQPIKQLTAHLTSYKVFLDDKEQSFENPVVNIDGKLYVPLNEFAGKLDMKVKTDKTEKTSNVKKNDDELISIYVFPSNPTGIVYRLDLFKDGQLSTTVGFGKIPMETIEGFVDEIVVPSVPAKITRYTKLSASEMKNLTNLISKITVDEKGNGGQVEDGWLAMVSYQGKLHRYATENNKRFWWGSDHMFEIIQTLVKNSPIEVIEFSIEDPDEDYYYSKKHQW